MTILTPKQTRTLGPRPIKSWENGSTLTAEVRFDDQCGNGHNSFAITGTIRDKYGKEIGGGCCHDEISRVFRELKPLLKWHLCSTDGPMHYISNTLYLAGDRDCHGLKAGESRQLVNGHSKLPSWELVAVDENGEFIPTYKLPKYADAEKAPESTFKLEWRPWCRIGEGKARELDAARRSAVWPDATDEELMAEDLRQRLEDRLPALLHDFQQAIEGFGFVW